MLKKAISIAALQFKQTMLNPFSLVYFLLVPLLFTFAIGQVYQSEAAAGPLALGVANLDSGTVGTQMVSALETGGNVAIRLVSAEEAQHSASGLDAGLVLPADASAQMRAGAPVAIHLYLHSNDGQKAEIAEQAVEAAMLRVESAQQAGATALRIADTLGLVNEAEQAAYQQNAAQAAEAQWASGAPVSLQVKPVTRSGQTLSPTGYSQSSPGMLVMFSLIVFLGGGVGILYEREEGTLRRLVVMPMHRSAILIGKMLGIYSAGIIQMVLLIVAGALIFGVNWGRSPLALALVVIVFALAAASLGILISALARSGAQAGALVNVIVLSFSALGGAWWPLEVVPAWLRTVGHLLPTAWAMDAFQDIITRGLDMQAILPEIAVLFGFAVVFLALSIRAFRYE